MNNEVMPEQLTNLLIILSAILVFVLVVLVIALIVVSTKSKRKSKSNNSKKIAVNNATTNNKNEKKKKKETGIKEYTKYAVDKFMEFDEIKDSMISQKNGVRYLMVISCQGVNYDLMSGVEKTSVEQGFIEFLNTLRHPVQIYVQTRKVDLGKSVETYKNKVGQIEKKYSDLRFKYNLMVNSNTGEYSQEEIERTWYDLTRQTNLFEYGRDIISNTEKMSLNRNVLKKEYYIIIPYFTAELGNNEYDKEEIRNMAFSELYTKAQSIIRTLVSCGVQGKVLNTNELAELLYISYNRDESEVYSLERALQAKFDELYATAPDVLNKKIRELDKEIERRATELANKKVFEVKSEKQKTIEEKEENMDDIVKRLAKVILTENERVIGKSVAKKAQDKIDEEGGSN